MHPAYSVIIFTTASGAGYGLLFWLSLALLTGILPESRWLILALLVPSLILITLGLLSSTLHLGHPERAHRAFSQWRSSWLSREGIAAVLTYIPAMLLGLLWLLGIDSLWMPWLAALSATGSAITVFCTAKIYASLRTIRQWHLKLVPSFYLAASAATGAIALALILALFSQATLLTALLVLLSLVIALLLKLTYWRQIDENKGQYTVEMATGLGAIGKARPLDPPHTMPNFVMREMGYQIGRKHALKLRKIVTVCLFAIPISLTLLVLLTGWAVPFYALAVFAATAGIVIERWLFFAEAEHVSMLYYGTNRA